MDTVQKLSHYLDIFRFGIFGHDNEFHFSRDEKQEDNEDRTQTSYELKAHSE